MHDVVVLAYISLQLIYCSFRNRQVCLKSLIYVNICPFALLANLMAIKVLGVPVGIVSGWSER